MQTLDFFLNYYLHIIFYIIIFPTYFKYIYDLIKHKFGNDIYEAHEMLCAY